MPLPLLIPLVAMGLSAAGSAYGSSKSAEANRKADHYLRGRMSALDADYAQNYYKDFLDSSTARSAVSRLNRTFKDEADKLRGRSIVTGSTAEAELAGKDNLQQRYADAVSNLAGVGTQYKQNIKNQYMQNRAGLENQTYANLAGKATNWSNFGQNVTNAGSNILKSWAAGGFDTTGNGQVKVTPETINYE